MTTPQTMGELIDQFEAELIAKDKATTPRATSSGGTAPPGTAPARSQAHRH